MNIVVVVIDSLRKDHVGAYGNNWIRTPHLDAFAKESMTYTAAYPESLPTLPVRRALHTGRRCYPFPELDGAPDGTYAYPAWGPIPENQRSVSSLLQANGYRTGLISDCYHMFKSGMNYSRGFTTWEWVRGQEVDSYKSGPKITDEEVMSYIPEASRNNRHLMQFMKMYLMNNAHLAEEDRSCAQVFRSGARWIEENQDANSFYLMLDSFDPHEPWLPPAYYRKLYDDSDSATNACESPYFAWEGLVSPAELKRMQSNYAGLVTMVDRWFGFFMESLQNSGKLKDTVVAVISDHGHNLGLRGDAQRISKEAHPMTHAIADLVLMIRHPGGEGKGQTCEKLVYNHDLMRTLLDMASVESDPGMDGMNIWQPALKKDQATRSHISCCWGTAVTVVTDKWWFNSDVWGDGRRLFDLNGDKYHENNLAGQKPELCEELLKLAIDDAGGWDKLPKSLENYKQRAGCRLNGFAAEPYAVTGWCLDGVSG